MPRHKDVKSLPSQNVGPRTTRDLLLAFDVQLAALFCCAPLAMGGRHDIGRVVFLALVATSVFTWLLRSAILNRCSWRWIGVEPLLMAALLLIIVQLLSLPAQWLRILSPELHASLPVWGEHSAVLALPSWQTLSIAPAVTQSALVMFVAYAALFCSITQRLETMNDVYKLLKLIALASVIMAVIGLMQFLSGCSEYLWFYHHPARSAAGKVTGCFTNQNHFADFVALGIGPLVWWTYRAKLRARRSQETRFLLPLALLGMVILSVLLTFSRGGVLVLAVEGLTCAVILGRSGLLHRRAIAAIVISIAVLAVALFVHGYEPLARRLETLLPGESLANASRERMDLWAADWHAAQDFLLLGSGAGTHAEVYPRYLPTQYNVRFTHAENTYLQILLENGIVGLGLTIAGVLIALGWCHCLLRSASRSVDAALAAGLMASVLATLIHAVVDFAWYIPACMTMAIGILAAVCRAAQLVRLQNSNEQSTEVTATSTSATGFGFFIPRPVWAVMALGIAGLTALLGPQYIGAASGAMHWDEYLRQSASASNVLLQDSDEARSTVEKLIHQLTLTVQSNPRHAQAWQRLAALNMRQFDLEQRDADNAMDVVQIREAVYGSEFPSQKEVHRWLSLAIGNNMRYLRNSAACGQRAAQLGAWRGDAYLYLAELAFLFDGHRELRDSLLTQAQRTRPYDGAVMFALGAEQLQRGNTEEALKQWKDAFHRNEELRRRVVQFLGPQVHPAVVMQAFSPDAASLQQLFEIHRDRGDQELAVFVASRLEPRLVKQAKRAGSDIAAPRWHQAAELAWYQGKQSTSLAYLQRAVGLAPDKYDWRRMLGDRLSSVGEYADAATHYQWCLQRTPYDEALQTALTSARRQQIQNAQSPASDQNRATIQR